MKIKNILFSLALALPVFALTSCQDDTEEIFDDASSLRMQEALENAKAVLRGAENGWVMDYYVGSNQQYGGYAVTIKFDSLTCTAASELTPEPATSYYKMTTDQGPVLTFDTYNVVLHALATPSQNNYEGYHADFEFVVMSATPDLVVLKGKKIGNYAYLHPLKEPMIDYLNKTYVMQDSIYVATAGCKVGGDSIVAEFDYSSRNVTFSNLMDTTFSETRYFTYTDQGLRLYSDVNVGGVSLSDFTYDYANRVFTSVNAGSDGVTLQGHMPDNYVDFKDFVGTYWLHYIRNLADGQSVPDSVQVTLAISDTGDTYLMSGLNSHFDVVLTYNKALGSLEWNTQAVGTSDGYTVYLNAVNSRQGGNLYVAYPGCGMLTEWNMDSENPVFTWVSNDDAMLSTDSWCLWLSDEEGRNSYGQFTGWPFAGGTVTLTYVTRMVKIN